MPEGVPGLRSLLVEVAVVDVPEEAVLIKLG